MLTSDPQVAGTVQGDFAGGYVEVQFDHSGDGYVDGYTYSYSPGESFTYDPRWYDYSLTECAGTVTLKYRTVEYDWSYNAVMGDWQSFTFTLQPPLEPEISVVGEDWYGYPQEIQDGYGSVYFDSTPVGSPATKTLAIYNTGTDTLTLDPDSLTLPAGFSLVTPLASSVAPGGSAALTVQLDAAAGGQFQGPLSFSSNDADESPFDVWLYGDVYAAEPEIEVQDTYAYTTLSNGISTVELGSTPLGSPVSRSFTICNDGNGTLTLDPASLTLPPGFSLVGSFPTAVAAFSSASFTIQLNAAAAGNYSGSVSFASDDADENPFRWMMSGTVIGTAAVVSVQSARDAVEGGQAGYVRLARTGDVSQELTVYYAIDLMASQATPGTDFLYLGGTSAANPGRGSVTFDPGGARLRTSRSWP